LTAIRVTPFNFEGLLSACACPVALLVFADVCVALHHMVPLVLTNDEVVVCISTPLFDIVLRKVLLLHTAVVPEMLLVALGSIKAWLLHHLMVEASSGLGALSRGLGVGCPSISVVEDLFDDLIQLEGVVLWSLLLLLLYGIAVCGSTTQISLLSF
jgi:hypothetical protein